MKFALLLLLGLAGCAPKHVTGFTAPPECVQVKCSGEWVVRPDKGVSCRGKLIASVSCYSAKPLK